MHAHTRPNPRRALGLVLVLAGVAVWLAGGALYLGNVTGLMPTVPYAGSVTISAGAILEALGIPLVRAIPLATGIERRPTSLVIVIPALILFGIVLLCAALVFGQNFDHPTPAGGWIASGAFLLVSIAIVSALVRDVVLRFDRRPVPARADPVERG